MGTCNLNAQSTRVIVWVIIVCFIHGFVAAYCCIAVTSSIPGACNSAVVTSLGISHPCPVLLTGLSGHMIYICSMSTGVLHGCRYKVNHGMKDYELTNLPSTETRQCSPTVLTEGYNL